MTIIDKEIAVAKALYGFELEHGFIDPREREDGANDVYRAMARVVIETLRAHSEKNKTP